MLFNSHEFIFLFLPGVIGLYFFLARFGENGRLAAMLCGSVVFYACWDVRFLVLLAGSVLWNFAIGTKLGRSVRAGDARVNFLLAAGVAGNLLVLATFKYAHFFLDNYNALTGDNIVLGRIILPLGISFFTFEEIGYLVDIRRGSDYKPDLLRFAVFVTFFPRLVAGPILRYNEIVPQLTEKKQGASPAGDIAVGLTMFFIGLAKKAVLADGIAPFASQGFMAAAHGGSLDLFAAWGAALAYTCQLYFDFSGYSDMAIGAARCFGVRFPMNFNSPYKAASIIEFWHRWHITLSRFLRDYLYISLGGNRKGRARRYVNLMITMLLGGLWHGANWTFVAWGGLHGSYLVVNHAWHAVRQRLGIRPIPGGRVLGMILTFGAVVIAWVFFRSPSFSAAINMIQGMAGLHGANIPTSFESLLRPLHGVLNSLGIGFGGGSGEEMMQQWLWIVALLCIAFFLPNSQQLLARASPVLEMTDASGAVTPIPAWRQWMPTVPWAVATGILAFVGISAITRVSEFLYWQF